ncbi:MAG: DUF1801 domain-containing protein [Gemmatimonas sp.]
MADTKTKPTTVAVKDFIARVENDTRREDAMKLLTLFEQVTGWKAQMWGPTIIGFGKYTYTYETGHSGDSSVVGFSPRAASLSIYSGLYAEEAAPYLKALGKHKVSKACIYINKLDDIDLAAFEKLIKAGVARMKLRAKEQGWPLSGS